MKKILFYTDTPLFGGAEKQMFVLAKYLNDYKVVLVCRDNKHNQSWLHEFEKLPHCQIETVKTNSKNGLGNFWHLRKAIRKHQPKLIHAHLWNPLACKYIYPATILSNIPLVITEHDPFKLSAPKSLIKKITLAATNKIICISKANRNFLAQLYPRHSKKLQVIHNGIELAKPIKSKRSGILSVGTLHQRKGYRYLIEAISKLPEQNVKIAGEGPERAKLEKLIKNLNLVNRVELLGYRDDITKLMSEAEVFVLPSLKEAFGLVILEAMQAGTPVISTRAGGVPEIITNGENGLLVEAGDSQQLTEAIKKVLLKRDLSNKLSKSGLKRVKEFSAQKCAELTAKIYRQYAK